MTRAALLSLVCLVASVAYAHDHNRPDLNGWYSGLKSKHGGPCCGGPTIDAKTLDGPDWGLKDGHYRVFLEGDWRDVPDDAVITEPNKDGRALVWPTYYSSFGAPIRIEIRCFMPGVLT